MPKFSRTKLGDDALTEEETAFLRSERAAPVVRSFVARQHEVVGTRTSAYRKVAAAARAEREALMEVAILAVVRARSEGSLMSDARVSALESEQSRLERELTQTRQRLQIATAAPALAIHSDGTQR